jgi:LmbE family N-acetylglucosaminyl deacetylase
MEIENIKNCNILVLAAHPDDAELACFGTLKKLSKHNSITVLLLTHGGLEYNEGKEIDRVNESKMSFDGIAQIIALDFPVACLTINAQLIQAVDVQVSHINPDILFTQTIWDTHQDHRVVEELSLSICRRKPITRIGYHSISSTNNFPTNLIVDIEDVFEQKIIALNCHQSQLSRDYFDKNWLRQWHFDKTATAAGFNCVELFHIYQLFLKDTK